MSAAHRWKHFRALDDHDFTRPALSNLYRLGSWGTVRAEPRASARPLTPREEAVLRLVADGKSDKQVAAALGASVRTMQKHLENAYAKLGVSNRTAAAIRLQAMRRVT